MSSRVIVNALRRERAELALRWVGQFTVIRTASGLSAVSLDESLVFAMFDDFIALLDPAAAADAASPPARSAVSNEMADLPDGIAVTIELLQAGAQVLGAFAVENSGPWAAWTVRSRNHFLGELDAVFPVLVCREVGAWCARIAPGELRDGPIKSRDVAILPAWVRANARRN